MDCKISNIVKQVITTLIIVIEQSDTRRIEAHFRQFDGKCAFVQILAAMPLRPFLNSRWNIRRKNARIETDFLASSTCGRMSENVHTSMSSRTRFLRPEKMTTRDNYLRKNDRGQQACDQGVVSRDVCADGHFRSDAPLHRIFEILSNPGLPDALRPTAHSKKSGKANFQLSTDQSPLIVGRIPD